MRIIAGRLRGRRLGAVPEGVRPTSDRVRESLFSALGTLEGARVLDLFAGTGALGFEALSRGAKQVVFVDVSRRAQRRLRENARALGLSEPDEVAIVGAEAHKALARLQRVGGPPFDLVFLDPPYATDDRTAVLETLFGAGILAAGATVVVEGPKRHPVPRLPGVKLLDARDYGDTKLTWLEPAGAIEE